MISFGKLVLDIAIGLTLFHFLLFVVPEVLLVERGSQQHVRMKSRDSILQRIEQFTVMTTLTTLFWYFAK